MEKMAFSVNFMSRRILKRLFMVPIFFMFLHRLRSALTCCPHPLPGCFPPTVVGTPRSLYIHLTISSSF